jgi:hypothetical protein
MNPAKFLDSKVESAVAALARLQTPRITKISGVKRAAIGRHQILISKVKFHIVTPQMLVMFRWRQLPFQLHSQLFAENSSDTPFSFLAKRIDSQDSPLFSLTNHLR